MKIHFIDEPELEFGSGGRHIDIRHGLSTYGPLDRGHSTSQNAIRVGVVGAAPDVERLHTWFDHCRSGIEAKESNRRTLFVAFPGFGDNNSFCDFVVDDRLTELISGSDLRAISTLEPEDFLIGSVERFIQGASDVIEKANAQVVLCLLPEEFIRRIDIPEVAEVGPRSRRRRREGHVVWHDVFKARCLRLPRPVQLVRPAIYGGGVRRYSRDGRASREMQDEATRAWNFFCALYYKAGRSPWRLVREPTDLLTCYVGISFYDDPLSESLRTSMAQVFNERGEGMIVRGGPALLDDADRSPHLSPRDASQLLLAAVEAFRREHRTMPARLVCHKSSSFNPSEIAGCMQAIEESRLDSFDLLSLRSSRTRLYRPGAYPPLRGTAIEHEEGCLLYTQGSVDFYRCYPGLYAPRTLDITLDRVESGANGLLREILALTKMNWNSTELINLEPVTLSAARGVVTSCDMCRLAMSCSNDSLGICKRGRLLCVEPKKTRS